MKHLCYVHEYVCFANQLHWWNNAHWHPMNDFWSPNPKSTTWTTSSNLKYLKELRKFLLFLVEFIQKQSGNSVITSCQWVTLEFQLIFVTITILNIITKVCIFDLSVSKHFWVNLNYCLDILRRWKGVSGKNVYFFELNWFSSVVMDEFVHNQASIIHEVCTKITE